MILLELKSPNSSQIAKFNWQLSLLTAQDGNNEIIQTIRYLCDERTELLPFLSENLEPNTFNDFEKMKVLCSKFNDQVEQLEKVTLEKQMASTNLIKFIMHITYNRAVLEPEKLNHYEPFSPQVYGETSFDLIDQMLQKVQVNETDTFIDLGSGVGNVVLQVAASVKCKKCIGIEKADWPALYAVNMEKEFRFWMDFFGKRFSDFKIYKGDFLSDDQIIEVDVENEEMLETSQKTKSLSMGEYVKELINEANLIFCNNYAFGAEVDHQLKLRFCNMLEGSLIVSSKPFCSLNFRINPRNLNDIGTILNVTEIEPVNGHVSWTDKPISYYFHRIDRTLLEKFFERRKNPNKYRDEENSNSCSSSPNSSPQISPNGENSSSNESDNRVKARKRKAKNEEPSEKSKAARISNKKRKSSTSSSSALNSSLNRSIDSNKSSKQRTKSDTSSKKSKKCMNKLSKKASDALKILDKEALKSLSKAKKQKLHKISPNGSLNDNGPSNKCNITSLTHFMDNKNNYDYKRLKDCKVQTKYLPNLANELNYKMSTPNSEQNSCVIAKSFASLDNIDLDSNIDEKSARKQLGDSIVDDLDSYLKKCKNHFLRYFMEMKTENFKEKLQSKLNEERRIRKYLLDKISVREAQINALLNDGIKIMKNKAEEFGLKSIKTPYDLINYAKSIVHDNESMLTKIKHIEEKIKRVESKMNIKVKACGKETPKIEKTVLLTKLISQNFDKKAIDQNNNKNEQDPVVEKSLQDDENRPQRSLSSRSTNTTMTANEVGDDEASSCNARSSRSSSSSDMDDMNVKSKTSSNHDAKKSSAPKAKTNGKMLLEQMFSPTADSSKLDALRNFKIPRASSTSSSTSSASSAHALTNTDDSHGDLKKSKVSPPNSPILPSMVYTNNFVNQKVATNLNPPIFLTDPLSRQISADSNSNSTCQSQCSTASSSSSPLHGSGMKQSTAYYHPKKSHFRQYLLESTTAAHNDQQQQRQKFSDDQELQNSTQTHQITTSLSKYGRGSPLPSSLTFFAENNYSNEPSASFNRLTQTGFSRQQPN